MCEKHNQMICFCGTCRHHNKTSGDSELYGFPYPCNSCNPVYDCQWESTNITHDQEQEYDDIQAQADADKQRQDEEEAAQYEEQAKAEDEAKAQAEADAAAAEAEAQYEEY